MRRRKKRTTHTAAIAARVDEAQGCPPAERVSSAYLVSLLFSALLVGLLAGPALLPGRGLCTDAWFYTDSVYARLPQARDLRPCFLEDPTPHAQDHPFLLHAARCLQAGEAPLWNPYQAAGAPLLADFYSAPFYPLKLVPYLFPSPRGLDLFLLLRLVLAGPLMYFLVRTLRRSRIAALLAQAAWTLSGFLVAHFPYVSLQTVVLFPLLLAVVERLVARPGPRTAAALGATFGLLLHSGHPEIVFIALFGGALWFLARVASAAVRARSLAPAARPVGFALVAAALGVGIGLCLLLPFQEFVANAWTYKLAEPGAREIPPLAGVQAVRRGIALVCPNLSEALLPIYEPGTGAVELYYSLADSYAYMTYCGAAVLALACYAGLRRRLPLPCLVFLLAEAGIVFNLPVARWLRALPLLGFAYAHYTLFLLTCAVVVAAAHGLDRLVADLDPGTSSNGAAPPRPSSSAPTSPPTPPSGRPRYYLALTALFPVAAALGWLYFAGLSTPAKTHARLFDEIVGRLEPAALTALAPAITERFLLVAGLWAALLVLCRLIEKKSIPVRFLGPAVLALTVADLLLNGRGYLTPQPLFEVSAPEPAPLAFLRSRPGKGRVLGLLGANLSPNRATAERIPDVRIVEPIQVRRFREAMVLADPAIGGQRTSTFPVRPDAPLWNLLGVRYVLQSPFPTTYGMNLSGPLAGGSLLSGGEGAPPLRLEPPRFVKAYEDPDCRIYENTACLPRAFLVRRAARVEPGIDELARALREGADYAFDRRFVVEDADGRLDERLGALSGDRRGGGVGAGTGADAEAPSPCEIVVDEAHRVVVRARPEVPSLLVLADTFYPGWQATVDGRVATIYPVNHLVRGVFVAAGDHEVEFRFAPWTWRVGKWGSLASLALCVVLGFRRGRRRAADGTDSAGGRG
ncbi:MAG: hypothetical protein HYZ53_00750 [Planctomycetes bacterium]|nr:hypothetical protein [Planctomycetota bacterium]